MGKSQRNDGVVGRFETLFLVLFVSPSKIQLQNGGTCEIYRGTCLCFKDLWVFFGSKGSDVV